VSTVHRRENSIRSTLDGEVYERHQLRHIAMSCDESIVNISWMGGSVANPIETGQFAEPAYEFAETPFFAIGTLPVIGIHVLAKKRDLAGSCPNSVTRLCQDLDHRARVFGATRVRHDAKAAKLIASFLNGEKRRHSFCR
jgi:hypothetical protein